MNKPVPFPLMNHYAPKTDVLDRICAYAHFDENDDYKEGQSLFRRNIAETFEDVEGDDHPLWHADFRLAVSEWDARPKVAGVSLFDDASNLTRMDWTAHERAFGFLPAEKRGKVLVNYGPSGTGKTVSARWLQDCRALPEGEIVPAFVTSAEFAEFGAYKNKAVKLVEVLKGVQMRFNPKRDFKDIVPARRCASVIDGIAGEKLSVSETFALLAAIEGCTDRGEYDLILTTPQNTREAFAAQLPGGAAKEAIIARLNERGTFIAYRPDRVGACPWIADEHYNLREPYALPASRDEEYHA